MDISSQEAFYQLHRWNNNLVTLIGYRLNSHGITLTPILSKILSSDPYNCWSLLRRKSSYREKNLRVGVDAVRLIEDHIVLEGVCTARGDFKCFQGHGGRYHCIGRRHRGNNVFNNALKD